MRNPFWIGIVMGAVAVSGCGVMDKRAAPGDDDEPAVVEERGTTGDQDAYEAERQALGEGRGIEGMALDDPDSPLSNRTIYFEFDSSEIASEDREIIAAHANYLAANPDMTVILEGHADERGSREYNIALGERRAQSVRQLMEFQGAAPEQIRVVSYGEEKPAVEGHNESAWSRNRRVEIVYLEQ